MFEMKGDESVPGRDGTGPMGFGPGPGRGSARSGGAGPVGTCICPKCKTKVNHEAGVPCTSMKCPKCGAALIRT